MFPFSKEGAADDAVFDIGLAKTRLEGLAYSTVTSLLMNAALRLFSATPKKLEPVPKDAVEARTVRLNNGLKVAFGLCMSVCVALGAYTTTMFALMAIYSKTALGMGLKGEFTQFFNEMAPYRGWGFQAFTYTILTYNISWVLSLILNYEGRLRWFMASPAMVVGLVGLYHYNSIMGIAGSIIFS